MVKGRTLLAGCAASFVLASINQLTAAYRVRYC